MEPINYMLPGTGLAAPTAAAIGQGVQIGQTVGLGLQAAQTAEAQRLALARETQLKEQAAAAKAAADAEAKARQDQMMRDLAEEANRGATTEGVRALMIKYPQQAENLLRGLNSLSESEREERKGQMLRTAAAIEAGQPEVASAFLRDTAKAYAERRPRDAEALIKVADSIDEAPGNAQLVLKMQLAELMGPDFERAFTGLRKQDADVEKTEAEARIKTAEAEATPAKLVADRILTEQQAARLKSQTAIDWARFGLDKQRLQVDAAKAVREMGRMDPATAKEVTASTVAAASAGQMARNARALQQKFNELATEFGAGAGLASRLWEVGKELTGTEDAKSAIRKQFAALAASDLVKNLPPGAASDKDIELLRSGIPSEFGDPRRVSEYLDTVAKVAESAEKFERRKANYLNRNGDLGAARETIQIDDIVIPAGVSFIDAMVTEQKKQQAQRDLGGDADMLE